MAQGLETMVELEAQVTRNAVTKLLTMQYSGIAGQFQPIVSDDPQEQGEVHDGLVGW